MAKGCVGCCRHPSQVEGKPIQSQITVCGFKAMEGVSAEVFMWL
jgi:hypothetical protein